MRIGVPIKWRGGEWGWISSWQHPTCLRIPDRTKAELMNEIHGLGNLTPENREATLAGLSLTPVCQNGYAAIWCFQSTPGCVGLIA